MTDIKSLPKILYIEDNPDSRALVRRVLGRNFVVLEAGDPLHGIELAENTQPDLVLLDINLPNMSGIDVAVRLRSLLSPSTPIVAVTADISDETRARALAAGFAGVLTKPIDVLTLEEQIYAFLRGKRETLPDPERYLRAYQSEVVERLEARLRELSNLLERNTYLQRQNQMVIEALLRRQRLLEAGARVSHAVTSILDLDELLRSTVDILCSEFNLDYAGIFLLAEDGQRLELHAGRNASENDPKQPTELPVDEQSLPGRAILEQKAQLISAPTSQEALFLQGFSSPHQAEIALPLVFKGRTLGVLVAHSDPSHAFEEEDMTALQLMADQIANAIHNAQLLRQLEAANQELLRSKTFEAIATATGEAIHWVGNKAAPVPGSVQRVREDLAHLLALFQALLNASPSAGQEHPLRPLAEGIFEEAQQMGLDLAALSAELLSRPATQRSALISLSSILEDLAIIETSAQTILSIKENLIGPARQRHPRAFSLTDELERMIRNMALPEGVVTMDVAPDLPPVFGDPRQMEQVFNNLVKNAWEALEGHPQPRIHVSIKRSNNPGFLLVCVQDNGPGIPPEIQEKIWMSFFTTKGHKGGTGLGLSACLEMVRQNNGKIWMESQVGQGTTFFVLLPVSTSHQEPVPAA